MEQRDLLEKTKIKAIKHHKHKRILFLTRLAQFVRDYWVLALFIVSILLTVNIEIHVHNPPLLNMILGKYI